jgi:hypothetical protein
VNEEQRAIEGCAERGRYEMRVEWIEVLDSVRGALYMLYFIASS